MLSITDIHKLIKKSRFSKNDVVYGTEGQCASFALALHHFLTDKGMKSKIFVMGDGNDNRTWGHVLVYCLDTYFDITGRVIIDRKYRNAFGANLFAMSEKQLLKDIKFLKKHEMSLYDENDRYDTWKNKLIKTPPISPTQDRDVEKYKNILKVKEKSFLNNVVKEILKKIPHIEEIWIRGAKPQGLKSDLWSFAVFIEMEEDKSERISFSNRKYTIQYGIASDLKQIDGRNIDITIQYANPNTPFAKLTKKEGFRLWAK